MADPVKEKGIIAVLCPKCEKVLGKFADGKTEARDVTCKECSENDLNDLTVAVPIVLVKQPGAAA